MDFHVLFAGLLPIQVTSIDVLPINSSNAHESHLLSYYSLEDQQILESIA